MNEMNEVPFDEKLLMGDKMVPRAVIQSTVCLPRMEWTRQGSSTHHRTQYSRTPEGSRAPLTRICATKFLFLVLKSFFGSSIIFFDDPGLRSLQSLNPHGSPTKAIFLKVIIIFSQRKVAEQISRVQSHSNGRNSRMGTRVNFEPNTRFYFQEFRKREAMAAW